MRTNGNLSQRSAGLRVVAPAEHFDPDEQDDCGVRGPCWLAALGVSAGLWAVLGLAAYGLLKRWELV